jgi:hypothetical protein
VTVDRLAALLHAEFICDGAPCALCESRAARLAAAGVTVAPDVSRVSIALQRAGVLSKSHMTYHDIARCFLAALNDGRDDLGAPAIHEQHAVTVAPQPDPDALGDEQ